MPKFNVNTNSILTVNKEGCKAYTMKDQEKLVSMVLTSFFNEPKFYGDTTAELVKLAESLCKTEPAFVAALAVYARKEFNLRSVSHALLAILAHEVESKPFVRKAVFAAALRADDLLEILACYIKMFGHPIPNSLKKGLADSLKKFSEFQISKYNGGNPSVSFKNLVNIIHPKPDTEEQSALFKKILEDNLETAVRWETELSAKGNNKETWESLLENNQVPYMALLRNLRNLLQANVSCMDKVNARIADPEQVARSKQLPFRYLSAYNEVYHLPGFTLSTMDALEQAAFASLKNIHRIPGRTVIAFDVSGSMGWGVSGKSQVKCSDIAALLAVMASSICEDYIVYSFSTQLTRVNIPKNAPILDTARKICSPGGGTCLELPLKEMVDNRIVADRLIMISDNEINSGYGFERCCQSLADEYRRSVNPDLWIHAIDLQGYGTTQFIGGRTNLISGWSEKVLDFIQTVEEGLDNLLKKIYNYSY